MNQPPRRSSSHASVNVEHRERKAEKIRRLIETCRPLARADILEVGAGAGVVSRALGCAAGSAGSATAVDVVDQRVVVDGYDFLEVDGARLPFPDASFDVVVSNHVLEHVGDREEQRIHLSEIHRVLRPDGLCYLATPNRWTFVEPHYKLLLLSWLPRSLRTPYLRTRSKGNEYDCDPLGPQELPRLVTKAGFHYEQKTFEAMRILLQTEAVSPVGRAVLSAPKFLVRLLYPVVPTFVLVLHVSQ